MFVTQTNKFRAIFHVIARKQGNPPIYYYRQWIDYSRWTAWAKIDLDIISDHVLPVVWNRRLYLFWAIINQKPDQSQENTKTGDQLMKDTPSDPKKHLEVQLAWSELKGNKWLAKQTSPQVIVIKNDEVKSDWIKYTEPFQVTLKSTIDRQLLRIDIFVNKKHHSEFTLGGIGNEVEAFVLDNTDLEKVSSDTRSIGQLKGWVLADLNTASNNKYNAMAIVPAPPNDKWINLIPESRLRVIDCTVTYKSNEECILNHADFYRLVVPHQFTYFDSDHWFFYEDVNRTYLVIRLYNGEYNFIPFYHAFVSLFIRELNSNGIDALFSRDLQLNPATIQKKSYGMPVFDDKEFANYYLPTNIVVNYPNEVVDFEKDAFAIYNWELFFHAPFIIGESLSNNQRFEDAKHWYEYIFNPTSGTNDPIPSRYWVTKPFYNMNNYQTQCIRNLINLINKGDPNVIDQVKEWQDNPFDPHIIAQLRQVAYQRAIVMKYIDNLIAWGDQLFSQDSMESINEATQMYVLASELLGPRPEVVSPLVVSPDKTYDELEKEGLDTFSNASALAAENLLGQVQSSINSGDYNKSISGSIQVNGSADPNTPKLPFFPTLYFNIPPNYQLLGYWDKVEDRLFKIRQCMNIKGVKRQLGLFAPPIDPGILVKAVASGLDLGSILNDISGALPPYRFRVIIREAIELCEMVLNFGNELLGVLEKRDADNLGLIRSGYEKKIYDQIKEVMQRKYDEATKQIDVITKQRQSILDRQTYYSQRKDILFNENEAIAICHQKSAIIFDDFAQIDECLAGNYNFFPNLSVGINGTGGSPSVTASWGGSNLGSSSSASSSTYRIRSAILQTKASLSQTIGSYQRRKDEWELQYNQATVELAAIDLQSEAAKIRQDIAQKELDNYDTNIQLATEVDDFLHSKYTNQELYRWMISQTSATYFQAYQLAYTLAKRAEQCFRRELGLSNSSYIQFGYWDSLKKGLLAGDKMLFDLQRLKSAYYEQNARELELTKHISLLAFDPYALVELRSKHECMIKLPEILFDLDNPGHYMRRIKSVGVTVPCVVGPYTSVSMTLTLHDNHIRISSDFNNYAFYPDKNNIGRFVDDQGGISSIVTSNAQNDSGMFELRFEDERYLPFECAGAISSWKLQLNPVYPQFDYSTISDVIIHLQYTARDGGEALRTEASEAVKKAHYDFALTENRRGLYLLISSRHEFGTNWQKFLNPESGKPQMLTINITPDRFPFFTNGLDITIKGIDIASKLPDSYNIAVTSPGGNVNIGTMVKDLGYLYHCYIDGSSKPPFVQIDLGNTLEPKSNLIWSFQFQRDKNPVQLSSLDIDDLLLVIHYEVKEPR